MILLLLLYTVVCPPEYWLSGIPTIHNRIQQITAPPLSYSVPKIDNNNDKDSTDTTPKITLEVTPLVLFQFNLQYLLILSHQSIIPTSPC
jgi:hypothetical protein